MDRATATLNAALDRVRAKHAATNHAIQLLDECWVPRSIVAQVFGVSKKTIFRWTNGHIIGQDPPFPKSFQVGCQSFYLRSEILAWKAVHDSRGGQL